MKEIIVKTQAEFDALPTKFDEYTRIYIQNDPSHGRIYVNVARDNSSVVAGGNSSVVAGDNSSVEAWGNSSVVARGNVGVHIFSEYSSVVLFMFAVCWMIRKGKVEKKSKNATIIEPKPMEGTDGWLEEQGIETAQDIILFKRVSYDLKTQEQTKNETLWEIGKTITQPSWQPDQNECGEGKFHACSRPYFCDQFRSNNGDKYIAIKINKDDLYVWSKSAKQYPHKVAFREGTVLYECDRMGKKKD